MSTEPRPQAAFIQVNQNAAEQDAPNSALVYLFQEVSKLASATHNGFLDARPPSIWLDETPRRGGLIAKKEDDARSFQPCQHSLSRMSAYSQVNSGKEESHSQENRECRSPWKVLSLINLQCERLMHRRCAEDSACSSTSSTTDLLKDQLSVKPLTAAADVAEQDCVRPVEGRDCTRGVNETQPHGHSVQPQTPEKTSAVKPELVEEKAAASPQWQRRREVKLSTKGQMVLNQGSKAETCFPNQDILTEPFPENVSQPTHILDAAQITKLAFHSNEDVALSKQLTLDCNANIVLTTVPLYDTQLPSPSSMLPSSLSFSTSEHHSLPKQDFKITGPIPERAHAPREEDFPSVSAQLQSHSASSTTSKPDPSEVPGTELSPPLSQQWRTKTQRKQPHPSRSVDLEDPGLQGVTFRMDAEVDDSREQCRLLITSKYRKELCKSVRKPRLRTRTSQKSLKSSSSEEESDPATHVSKDKVCASCCTRKTPMWRDAEDGTPLCNACGIRYKKYRVRCVNCWHIPRKEGNSNSCCLKCGNFVKLASAQRKHTP